MAYTPRNNNKKTSIGRSGNSRPKNKHKKRLAGSTYRGQGR